MRKPIAFLAALLLAAGSGVLDAGESQMVNFKVPIKLNHINQHIGVQAKIKCDVLGTDPSTHQQDAVLASGWETLDTGGWPIENWNGTVTATATVDGAKIEGVKRWECYLLLGDQKPSPTATDHRLRPAQGTQFVPLVKGSFPP